MANDKVDHAIANDKRTVPAQGEDRTLSCSANDF